MRGNAHVRFGRRAGETDRPRGRHRAPARPHLAGEKFDEVRRRVQNETLGHRGRKHDPLYRARRLLVLAHERLDERATSKLTGLLRAGDPWHEVEAAWWGRELLRDVNAADHLDAATTALETFFAWADQADVPELSRLARTLRIWRAKILAYHHRRLSNGRTEAMNQRAG